MDKFLTIKEAAEYLSVSTDTIKRYVEKGELPTYKLDSASRYKIEDLDSLVSRSFEVLLTRGLRASVSHVVPIKEGVEAWRVVIKFLDTNQQRKTVTFGEVTDVRPYYSEYHVYVTGEYLEDFAKLPATMEGAEKFALRYIKERFDQTADEKGERDLGKIEEMQVACSKGSCVMGEQL